jgi:hypothetical protein
MKSAAIDFWPPVARHFYCAAALAFIAAMGGCGGSTGILPGEMPLLKSDKKAVASDTQVRASGDGFALGDVERATLSPQQFAERMGDHLRAGKRYSARRLVQQFPDAALVVLRDPKSVNASPDTLVAIADAHDQQCHRGDGPAWGTVARDRAAQPSRYADFDEKRRQFMIHVQNGHVKEAQRLGLAAPNLAPGKALAIDVQNLNGIALVLDNRPREAVAAFQKALQAAGNGQPYEAVNLMLLLSDAQRRAGDSGAAERTWISAAEVATELAAGSMPIIDPILLERTAYLRPVNLSWPRPAQQRLNDLCVRQGFVFPASTPQISTVPQADFTDEAPLWTVIGHSRLARSESQAALVALKRAESMTSDPLAAGRLQIAEARALVRLGQSAAASAMLINLAGQNDPQLARPAMALLGTLKLRQGAVQPGFNLLHSAVEQDSTLVWPERTQAEADLGLAYLMIGDEAAGLRCLHGAQQSFDAAGQRDDLLQCLENEAAYLEQVKKQDLAKAVRKRLESLVAG